MIFLKRNNKPDPWYHEHTRNVNPGEIVRLHKIVNEPGRNATFPPEIWIRRSKAMGETHIYIASLCCYDYVGSSK